MACLMCGNPKNAGSGFPKHGRDVVIVFRTTRSEETDPGSFAFWKEVVQ